MYEYPCRLIRVVNGNTVEAIIDLGFGISIDQKIRLFGVDNTDDGMTALIKLLPRKFICHTVYNKRGKVGRVLGHIYAEEATGTLLNINDIMITQGFAINKVA